MPRARGADARPVGAPGSPSCARSSSSARPSRCTAITALRRSRRSPLASPCWHAARSGSRPPGRRGPRRSALLRSSVRCSRRSTIRYRRCRRFTIGVIASVPLAGIYQFAILPAIDGYTGAGDLPRAGLDSDRYLDGDPAIHAARPAAGGGHVAQSRIANELQCRHGVVSQYRHRGRHRQLDWRRGHQADARHRGGDRGPPAAAGRLAGPGRSRGSNISRRRAPSGRAGCSIASVS